MLYLNYIYPLLLLSLGRAVLGHPTAQDQTGPQISITQVNATTRWLSSNPPVQIFDIVLNNTGDKAWLTTGDDLRVSVKSPHLETVKPARVKRLRPGDSAIVQVGVENKHGVEAGSKGPATAVAHWGGGHGAASKTVTATYGIPSYNATPESVNTHEAPEWFRDAKLGIFIHWGLYSIPAYGGVGKNENYAEWYWSSQMSPSDPTRTYQYHLEKYGPEVLYDDFIANFTAEEFRPKEWVDLISDSGAQYFVQVTKHHDGYALFDMPETVSKRNSVKQLPHRDFLRELFDAAKKYQPHLRRGTYFSMPEWFNPAYSKYEWLNAFGVGPPKNPYTNKTVPYTGFVEVDDFISDIQYPQMNTLAYEYGTDIMWCDITTPSSRLSPKFAAQWLNRAYGENRHVAINSRCGTITGDFETPEYESSTSLSPRTWEATRGLDPHSFAYNAVTPESAYLNASGIITTLVDIVAKNGNFLLDIGPKGDGSIPEVMKTHLREAGIWIKSHGESIFSTKYWPSGPGDGDFRYTTTDDAFYIHLLTRPNGSVTIPDPVPYLHGDTVTVVGGSKHGTAVKAKVSDDKLTLDVSNEVAMGDKYVWTFKFEY